MLPYLKDKPWLMKLAVWETMEVLQDNYPHFHIRWDGFLPVLYERSEEN